MPVLANLCAVVRTMTGIWTIWAYIWVRVSVADAWEAPDRCMALFW